jgi:hypothetical protein
MWRAACALISCGYTILGGVSSPDVISTNLNNINDLKFYHEIRENLGGRGGRRGPYCGRTVLLPGCLIPSTDRGNCPFTTP